MPKFKKFYVLRAHITHKGETYTLEEEHYYYDDAQTSCDWHNGRETRPFIQYFVSQYTPEDMPC